MQAFKLKLSESHICAYFCSDIDNFLFVEEFVSYSEESAISQISTSISCGSKGNYIRENYTEIPVSEFQAIKAKALTKVSAFAAPALPSPVFAL